MIINDLFQTTKSTLAEFAPQSSGDSGNYFRELASAWYNGAYDSGSLEKGIKTNQDIERLLQRGIVAPDGKTRKYNIDYNSDFDGVIIFSDDYYEHSDYDDNGKEVDSRTGRPWGPYDYMEFKDEELDEGVAEAMTDYQRRRQRERDVDAGKPVTRQPKNPQNDYFARRKKDKEQGVAENQDWMKDLAARAAKMSKPGTPYVPPKQDPEKARRDLTARYPNIDELVAQAERNRDPNYDRAEGEAYYRGREAEHEYKRLKQIQRVIQGLNEAATKYKQVPSGSGIINPATGRGYTPDELEAEFPDYDFDKEEREAERKAELKRLKKEAEAEALKDLFKKTAYDPKGMASQIAKKTISQTDLMPQPPTVSKKVPTPTDNVVPFRPPSFTYSNLAQQPGMAQYMQQTPTTPKASPNFSQGPGGYTNVQTTVNMPATASTKATPTATQDVYDALIKMGYLPKAAAAAVKRLPPNISTQDAIKQVLKNTP